MEATGSQLVAEPMAHLSDGSSLDLETGASPAPLHGGGRGYWPQEAHAVPGKAGSEEGPTAPPECTHSL